MKQTQKIFFIAIGLLFVFGVNLRAQTPVDPQPLKVIEEIGEMKEKMSYCKAPSPIYSQYFY